MIKEQDLAQQRADFAVAKVHRRDIRIWAYKGIYL